MKGNLFEFLIVDVSAKKVSTEDAGDGDTASLKQSVHGVDTISRLIDGPDLPIIAYSHSSLLLSIIYPLFPRIAAR